MTTWSGFIVGKPETKGSLEPRIVRLPGGRIKIAQSDKPASLAWKKTMIAGIRKAHPELAGHHGPVTVDAMFVLDPAAGHGSGGHDLASWPDPIGQCCGDTDKYARNLGDALEQSGLIVNDSQITAWHAMKVWTSDSTGPCGAYWMVRTL